MLEIFLLIVMLMLIAKPFKFWHIKLFLIVIFALNFEIFDEPTVYHQYFKNDLVYCPECFSTQIEKCTEWLNELEYDSDSTSDNFLHSLPKRVQREFQLLRVKSKPQYKFIGKYYGRNIDQLRGLQLKLTTEELANIFLDEDRAGGIQYCPSTSIQRFVDTLSVNNTVLSELSVWLFLLINAEPIMLPFLEVLGLPVPITTGLCGFSTFQLYEGKSLEHYYDAPILLRIRIAQLLLEAAVRFTKGNLGFRFYITDMTAENIFYSEKNDKLFISGVDTLFIVDVLQPDPPPQFNTTHRYKYVECYDCFAFSPDEVCAHRMSDINVFTACLFLREDYKMNRENGFLAGIPYEILYPFPDFLDIINICVDCVEETCVSRYTAATTLIEYMNDILKHFGIV